jgi:hypothetical protein
MKTIGVLVREGSARRAAANARQLTRVKKRLSVVVRGA